VGYDAPMGDRMSVGADVDLSRSRLGTGVSPAVRARFDVTPSLQLAADASIRRQDRQSLRNEESMLGTVFPVDLFVTAGADGVPVGHARDVRLQAVLRPAAGLRVGLGAHARGLESIVFVAPETGGLYSEGGFEVGSARVRGLTVDVAGSGSRVGLLGSYVYERVEHRLATGTYRPSYAPLHRAQLGVVAHPTASLSVRLANVGVWGRHSTTLTTPVEWEACNLADGGCEIAGLPLHGSALGEGRPGPYLRTDLGVRKHWHVVTRGRDSTLTLYGTLSNLFGRPNVLNWVTDPDSGAVSSVDMLPRTPLVLGLEWAF